MKPCCTSQSVGSKSIRRQRQSDSVASIKHLENGTLTVMTNRESIKEDEVECPVCGDQVAKRGLFAHIFQSDDAPGEDHGPRFEVPDHVDVDDVKVTGERDVQMDYPEVVDVGDQYYLDTYTGKAYQGQRGLMVHLGQMAGQNNIPEDVTERHSASDFPKVEIDDDGNITEVQSWPSNDVPPLEPYLPWFSDEDHGYIAKHKIRDFVEEIEETTGAVTAEKIEERLL